MRNQLILLATILALSLSAQAELLVYKGNLVEKRSGNAALARHTYRSLLIIDNLTGAARKIDYYGADGGFYMVGPEQQFLTNSIVLKGGRTQTVLARAEAGAQDRPVVSVFAKGLNSRLQVSGSGAAVVPATLDWQLRSAGPISGEPVTLDEAGLYVYHAAFTITLNNRGEALADAEQTLRAYLEKNGYREIQFK